MDANRKAYARSELAAHTISFGSDEMAYTNVVSEFRESALNV